jgi:hypothetical protein
MIFKYDVLFFRFFIHTRTHICIYELVMVRTVRFIN